MPFAEEFLKVASREIESKYLATDFERASAIIMQAVEMCAKLEPSINVEDVDVYLHGSYANKSNIYFPSNMEIMVELTTTKRFSPEEVSLEGNYFIDVPLEFGPKEFRALFTEMMQNLVGDKITERPKSLRLSELEKIKHDIDITPCLSFHHYQHNDKKEVNRTRGILLHDTDIGRNIVSFPRLHSQNGFDKDKITDGNFKRMVRVFKTLHHLNVNEFSFTESSTGKGYFVECLLYNVPNELFIDSSTLTRAQRKNMATPLKDKKDQDLIIGDDEAEGKKQNKTVEHLPQSKIEIFNQIMNYLVNADMDDFICQNAVWELFGDAKEFWDQKRAEDFLNAIIRLHAAFPASRTFLA